MQPNIKNVLRSMVPTYFLQILKRKKQQKELYYWYKNGCPVPPPHLLKQNTISAYQKKSGYNIFIETGTFLGEMVESQKVNFNQVISIELGKELFANAQKKFAGDKNVKILHGDSGVVLLKVMDQIYEPAIFWLDGHYSGGITAKGETNCPIFEELKGIFKSSILTHIILIDDARLFNGQGDYPTISELSEYIKAKNENYQIVIKDDIIRCTVESSN